MQVLDIQQYACGLHLGLALISNKNPNFEMASSRGSMMRHVRHILAQ